MSAQNNLSIYFPKLARCEYVLKSSYDLLTHVRDVNFRIPLITQNPAYIEYMRFLFQK